MPIMSYLAYPAEGKKEELVEELGKIKGCSIRPAIDHDLVVVVTDTPGREQEKEVQERLQGIESLAFLALVAGYDDPEHQSEEPI